MHAKALRNRFRVVASEEDKVEHNGDEIQDEGVRSGVGVRSPEGNSDEPDLVVFKSAMERLNRSGRWKTTGLERRQVKRIGCNGRGIESRKQRLQALGTLDGSPQRDEDSSLVKVGVHLKKGRDRLEEWTKTKRRSRHENRTRRARKEVKATLAEKTRPEKRMVDVEVALMRKRAGGERRQSPAANARAEKRGSRQRSTASGYRLVHACGRSWHGLLTGAKACGGCPVTTEIRRSGARIGWADRSTNRQGAQRRVAILPAAARTRIPHRTHTPERRTRICAAAAQTEMQDENSPLTHPRVPSRVPAILYRHAPLTRRDDAGRRASMRREERCDGGGMSCWLRSILAQAEVDSLRLLARESHRGVVRGSRNAQPKSPDQTLFDREWRGNIRNITRGRPFAALCFLRRPSGEFLDRWSSLDVPPPLRSSPTANGNPRIPRRPSAQYLKHRVGREDEARCLDRLN
ncbi:hypothetical protein DFH09DRAFT_1067784 [Mycena vulgaris]|nr:hypothetical protein DFH09DRAFT_1067784 [Mycena vulgaris]